MSAISLDIIAQTARQRLGWSENESERLKAMVPSALKQLGIKVAYRTDKDALRKEIAVTVSGGIITLADPSILSDVLVETGELIINNVIAKSVPSYQDLTLKKPTDVYWWALRTPTKVHVANIGTGALGVVAQTGTLTFNYTPTLAEMDGNYDKELIDLVVILAGGGVEKPPAKELKEESAGVKVNLNT